MTDISRLARAARKGSSMNILTDSLGSYVSLLLLPLILIAIVAWVYRPGSRKNAQDDALIPFNEEQIDADIKIDRK
jgi:cbb3-type cytochrome oxidase subunit 3